MTQLEYEYAKGRLAGLKLALEFVKEDYAKDVLEKRARRLEIKLQGITVHDEVAELKAKNKELKEMVEKLLNLDKIYLNPVEIGKALKSLEGKDDNSK